MIISIDAKKTFDKIQHSFTKKNSQQGGYRGNVYACVLSRVLLFCNLVGCSLPASSAHRIF